MQAHTHPVTRGLDFPELSLVTAVCSSRVHFACSQHRPHDAQARLACPLSFLPPTHLTSYTPLTHTRCSRIAAPHFFFTRAIWSYLKKGRCHRRPWTATPPLYSEGQISPFKGTQPKSWLVDRRLTLPLRISRAARIPGQVDVIPAPSYPESAESGRPL